MNISRKSLNTQFRLVAAVIALFLVGGWILSNLYVNKVISQNTDSLILRDLVYTDIASLRKALRKNDNIHNTLKLTQ